ncbi:hypothetical protein COLO4_07478 [Corchorus olitorius]|uniref:Uncharacterized protein n=1 Tax=Corchorus olitorius TaxID=93759 RepID=A0A1R3KJP5_9ROSI|nr:hypothetical protein COLO4_07478 [Corchorus olitorius]
MLEETVEYGMFLKARGQGILQLFRMLVREEISPTEAHLVSRAYVSRPPLSEVKEPEAKQLQEVVHVAKEIAQIVTAQLEPRDGVADHVSSDEKSQEDCDREDDVEDDCYVSCEEVDIDIFIREDDLRWLERSAIATFNESVNIFYVSELLKDLHCDCSVRI